MGSTAFGRGGSATHRFPLWYESQSGNSEFNLHGLLQPNSDVFSTSETCCPVLEYKLYKDDGTVASLTTPDPFASLQSPTSMSRAKIVLDNSAVYGNPNHI